MVGGFKISILFSCDEDNILLYYHYYYYVWLLLYLYLAMFIR